MMQVAVIAVGGAVGSVLRYFLQKSVQADFPYGTLTVNIIGCFLIGCLWAASLKGMNEQLRLFLMTGF
ncbi:MAG: CrcB family protein, partial [Chitinophagaceae bacterium]